MTLARTDNEGAVELKGKHQLTIQVVDGAGKPLPWEKILLRRDDDTPIGWGAHPVGFGLTMGLGTWTNERGEKVYRGLEPGNYRLEVGRRGWWYGRYYSEDNVLHQTIHVSAERPTDSVSIQYHGRNTLGSGQSLGR